MTAAQNLTDQVIAVVTAELRRQSIVINHNRELEWLQVQVSFNAAGGVRRVQTRSQSTRDVDESAA